MSYVNNTAQLWLAEIWKNNPEVLPEERLPSERISGWRLDDQHDHRVACQRNNPLDQRMPRNNPYDWDHPGSIDHLIRSSP